MPRPTLDEIFADMPQGATQTQSGTSRNTSERPSLDEIFKDMPQGATHTTSGVNTMPKITPVEDNSRRGWLDRHPWMKKIVDVPKDIARGVVKPIAETAVQFPRTVIASAAGLAGSKDIQEQYSKPVNVPFLGEVKGLSAVPGDSEKYGTATPGEMLGQSAQIGASLIGAEGAGSAIGASAKGRFIQGAMQGTESGIKSGALTGFAEGVSNKDKNAVDVYKDTVKGAIAGGAIGALAGGASGVLTKGGREAISASRTASAAKKAEQEALDITMPKVTNKASEEALSEGRVATKGLLKRQVILPSKQDKEVAKAVAGVVSQKFSPQENINAIRNSIKSVAQDKVQPILEANPRPYNMNTFKTRIGDLKMPTLFKADPTLEKTYQLVQQRASEIADEYPKTKYGSWQARQEFDRAIDREFPRLFDGSGRDNAIKHAVNDVRGAWNDFIVEGLPENNGVKQSFKKMSNMYQAIDNISEKGAGDVGSNTLQRFAKKNPRLTKALELGIAGAIGGETINKGKQLLSD